MEPEPNNSFKTRIDVNLITLVVFIVVVCILSVFAIWKRDNITVPSPSVTPVVTDQKTIDDQIKLFNSLKINFPLYESSTNIEISKVPQIFKKFIADGGAILYLYSVKYESSKTGYQFIYDLNQSLSKSKTQFEQLTANLSGWNKLSSGNTEISSIIEGEYSNNLIQIRLSKRTDDSTLVMIRIITK